MSQDGAEMGRDAPRWAEMGRDAPRCAEMCPTARCALETTSASQMLILSSCHAPARTYQNIAEERGKEPFKDFEVIFNRCLSGIFF